MLIKVGYLKTSTINAVQAYHLELVEFNKKRIFIEFAKPNKESVLDSLIHCIIVATNAIGIGIDNLDVQLFFQLGVLL